MIGLIVSVGDALDPLVIAAVSNLVVIGVGVGIGVGVVVAVGVVVGAGVGVGVGGGTPTTITPRSPDVTGWSCVNFLIVKNTPSFT